MEEHQTRQLAAILFADIEGYTALMQGDEEAAARARNRHREVFEEQHRVHHGKIIQYYGDGALSIFKSAIEAVECAIRIQRLLQEGDPVVPTRVGLHMGDIVYSDTDVYGDGVNFASRIESMGVAGGILLSGKINGELKNHKHISTRSLGYFELKNIAEPVEVFAVTNPGIVVPERSALKGKRKKPSRSIAVLPFVNRGPGAENEYFADGMTEEIINALTRVKELKVTSRTSSFFFKDKQIPMQRIGLDLGVSVILEGSVRLAGSKMRVTARLIDVKDDFHFWSETFDRSIEDVFAVQDEISLLIADRLREHLGHFDIGEHLVEAPGVPVEAYKQYLQSRYHILKMSEPEVRLGISILESVISAHPDFALAYLGVHLGYAMLGTLGFLPASEAFPAGQPFLDKAIQLNPELPECQLNLSYMAFLQDWDFDAAYRHLGKALELRPTVEYYQSMASVLVAEGQCTAASNYIETALQLDPFSAINYHLKGFIAYVQEEYEPAIRLFLKSVSLRSDSRVSVLYHGQTLILMGREQEALTFFQNLPDEPNDLVKAGGTALALAAMGKEAEAREGMNRLESALQSEQMERAMNLLILCQVQLNKPDLALSLLENALAARLPMLLYFSIEPMLKPLRALPRFQSLMRQVMGKRSALPATGKKYKRSLIDPPALRQYKQALEELMRDQKPYLNPELTLRELARLLDIRPNQLSRVLNEGFDRNFSEYVNTYRLEDFKSRAADPAQRHLTILGLAYESGFNSKTVFNTFFKKTMGITPSAYWKELEN